MEECAICKTTQLNYAHSLSQKDREEVGKATRTIRLEKNEVIFLENEKLQNLFCIQEGVCKFSKLDEKGKEHILKLLGKGELMGRRSVISNEGAAVSAKAITDTVLYTVDKKPFLRTLKKNNAFCMDVLRGLVADTKKDEDILLIFGNHKSIKERLAGLLCYLLDKFGKDKDGSLSAKLKREDMASITGTSVEYVINLLKKFKQEKLIKLQGRNIYISSDKGLRKLSGN